WRRFCFPGRSGGAVALTAPYHAQGVGPVTGPGSLAVDGAVFRLLSVAAADRYWELAVPAVDVPLVRAALHPPRA
ncbi:hypothetical protein, partial [Streptomyces sp. NPDC059762]|uniref:hypothetical protein n=1 Tax=Streptomyces sp. NPDC059762 TaxID=3346938 RepID=UPI003658C95F